MKKILFILIVLIPSVCFGQNFQINITAITGTDTTIYLEARNSELVTFDFSNFNADDATLDLGQSDDRVSFVSAEITGVTWPLTLSKVTFTKTANGYTRNRTSFRDVSGKWCGTYIAFTLTKTSVTAGTLKVWY